MFSSSLGGLCPRRCRASAAFVSTDHPVTPFNAGSGDSTRPGKNPDGHEGQLHLRRKRLPYSAHDSDGEGDKGSRSAVWKCACSPDRRVSKNNLEQETLKIP